MKKIKTASDWMQSRWYIFQFVQLFALFCNTLVVFFELAGIKKLAHYFSNSSKSLSTLFTLVMLRPWIESSIVWRVSWLGASGRLTSKGRPRWYPICLKKRVMAWEGVSPSSCSTSSVSCLSAGVQANGEGCSFWHGNFFHCTSDAIS